MVVLLGPNNHGKSNILLALEFALTSSAKPTIDDFFKFRGDENSLWIDLTFWQLTDQEKTTFKKYVKPDGQFTFRKSATLLDNSSVEVSYNGYLSEPEDVWLQGDTAGELTDRAKVNETPLGAIVPQTGRLTKAIIQEAQEKYVQANVAKLRFLDRLESGPLLGQKTVASGVLPDFYLIPAVRDLSDETKVKNTTAFGKLLTRAVRDMAEQDERFRTIRQQLETLVSSLNRSGNGENQRPAQLVSLEDALKSELKSWGVEVEVEVVPPVIEKIFELGTNLQVDDGVRTLAEFKGHGLQRAIIFALVKAWATTLKSKPRSDSQTAPRAASTSIIFAMEEPELFLHPQAQRLLSQALYDLVDNPEHQVLLCTHSTHFVDLDHYKSICIVTKPNSNTGSVIRQCKEELFAGENIEDRKKKFHMARWINPDRGEMFFSKRIAFVEGETEKTILPFLAKKMNIYNQEISTVDCGSKHNLPLYIAIANAFKLTYVVIHDEDPVPDPIPEGWNEDKIREKRRTFELNAIIKGAIDPAFGKQEMFAEDFEDVANVSKTQGKEKGKALAALEFYEGKTVDQIPIRLQDVVRSVFVD
jgi:CRISPR-associated exonuclease Cas4